MSASFVFSFPHRPKFSFPVNDNLLLLPGIEVEVREKVTLLGFQRNVQRKIPAKREMERRRKARRGKYMFVDGGFNEKLDVLYDTRQFHGCYNSKHCRLNIENPFQYFIQFSSSFSCLSFLLEGFLCTNKNCSFHRCSENRSSLFYFPPLSLTTLFPPSLSLRLFLS